MQPDPECLYKNLLKLFFARTLQKVHSRGVDNPLAHPTVKGGIIRAILGILTKTYKNIIRL